MPIFLSGKILGLSRSVIVDGDEVTLTDVKTTPDAHWHLDDRAHLSVQRVANARSLPLQVLPDDPRVVWWSQWDVTPRIDHVLDKREVSSHLKKLMSSCREIIDHTYFAGQYQVQNRLLDMLCEAHVDTSSLHDLDDITMQSFAARHDGVCARATYDNFGSSTGRMSIKSGPKILTMSKEHRHVFRSSWGSEGELISVDFSALEPRVIMTLMGKCELPADIYSDIGEKVGISAITRSTLKLMILAVLYGMSRKNFIVKFMTEADPDVAYDKIRDILCVKDILAKIKAEIVEGEFKNHYGRPLRCDNESLYVNHFTQSTAVDVACDGFLNLVEKNSDIIRPIFILHDELIVDVNKADVDKLKKRIGDGIYVPSLNTRFHTTTKVFNARKSDQ